MPRTKRMLLASGSVLASIVVVLLITRNKTAPLESQTIESATAVVLPQPQQTIKGWGCYPATYQMDRPLPENFHIFNRPNVQRLIFKELGISFMRCNILPGSYDARSDDGSLDTKYLDATLVRHLKLARRYGMSKYLLTVWSPPPVFKNPPITRGQDKAGRPSRLKTEREDDYCRYVVKVLDYLTRGKRLAKPFAYSIQNEPGYDPPLWDGTAYDAAQWRRVFKMMRRALDAGGYKDVLLIGPECGSYALSTQFMGGAGAPALKQDKAFAAALSGFAYHGYTLLSRRAPHPQQLREVAQIARSLGKDVWMTEWSIIAQKRTPLDHALEAMQRFGREVAYIPTNYWTWWQGWYLRHPKSEVLITGADDNHLHISKTYRVLQKLWHAAPPGSVVKHVQTTDPEIKGFDPYSVQTVAFDHPSHMTVLLVNPGGHTKKLTLQGLSGEKAGVYLTDASRDMAAQGTGTIARGITPIVLAPRSIVVVVTNRGSRKERR